MADILKEDYPPRAESSLGLSTNPDEKPRRRSLDAIAIDNSMDHIHAMVAQIERMNKESNTTSNSLANQKFKNYKEERRRSLEILGNGKSDQLDKVAAAYRNMKRGSDAEMAK
eukprot:TRINITY_DN1755_c0_g1::TRINITY_DN1755_c0_g1_i1::g.25150::m.25150 TRINITY_DN1755_c0_g1::TRINITY_DN1755_c0_g1_i1::g.25150  ORF type:complete len:113 (+),score=19.99 TRINITY_DN1755_c0_g1_i1:98-436(+)